MKNALYPSGVKTGELVHTYDRTTTTECSEKCRTAAPSVVRQKASFMY